MGFWVAITKNGLGRGWVMPPKVTCLSCMASSRALCTLAGARLISSARRNWVNTGPLRASNVPFSGRKIMVPVRSAGRRSGVNWILEKPALTQEESVRAARVFASPGTPSINTCPSQKRAVRSPILKSS